jgi:hypothetical protein
MGAFKCPKHGMQIAEPFCEHAACAVNERRPIDVYLQWADGWWISLCATCVRQLKVPETLDDLELVCGECISEWVDATGSDYLLRCQNPKSEFPT